MEGSSRDNGTGDIIQGAFAQAFSPPSHRQPLLSEPQAQPGMPTPATESPLNPGRVSQESTLANDSREDSTAAASANESWKAEYESQVETWRAQSSEAREKAEKERARWEAIRAAEQEEAVRRKADDIGDTPKVKEEQELGWETVSDRQSANPTDSTIVSETYLPSSAVGKRDSGTGTSHFISPPTNVGLPTTLPRMHSGVESESQKWEDIPSVASSFPSMSYPERTETPSPLQPHPPQSHSAPATATLAVFDSSLSARTRIKALLSSVAINMLLPFVNGVMLGFGEIFAKNVIMDFLGWTSPPSGSVAATTGIRVHTPWGQRQKQRP